MRAVTSLAIDPCAHYPTIQINHSNRNSPLQKKKRPIDPSQPSAPATPTAGPSAQPTAVGTPNSATPIRRPTGPLPPSQLASSHVPPAQQTPAQRPVQQQPPQRHPLPANPKTATTRPPGTGSGPIAAGATAKRKDREDGVNGHVGGGGGGVGTGVGGATGATGLKPAKKRKMVSTVFRSSVMHCAVSGFGNMGARCTRCASTWVECMHCWRVSILWGRFASGFASRFCAPGSPIRRWLW